MRGSNSDRQSEKSCPTTESRLTTNSYVRSSDPREFLASHSSGRSEDPHAGEPGLEGDVEPPSELFDGPDFSGVAQLAQLGNHSVFSWVGVQVAPSDSVVKRIAHHHVHISNGLGAKARGVCLGCPTGPEAAGCSLSASQVRSPHRGHRGGLWAQTIAFVTML